MTSLNGMALKHRLWYRKPAAEWNEALPIGNGRLGAMIFGGTAEEKLQLNEDSVWYGARATATTKMRCPICPRSAS